MGVLTLFYHCMLSVIILDVIYSALRYPWIPNFVTEISCDGEEMHKHDLMLSSMDFMVN